MDLDDALKELGQFGKFQAFYFTLLLFPVVLSAFRGTEYVFTTMNIPHRCLVPQCETPETAQFSDSWVSHAVSLTKSGVPEPCLRFRPSPLNTTTNATACPAELFTRDTEPCQTWVFAEPARTIAHDFNIMCPKDYWKLTFFSSISVFMSFFGISMAGILSDRFGRKTVLVLCSSLVCVSGVLRSFSPSYSFMATIEVVDGILSGGLYSTAFLLGLETLAPSRRLLGSTLISTYFAVGEMVMACIMWLVQDWRTVLRVFYGPMLAVVTLHWLLPESVRWLHTKGKEDQLKKVFAKISKMNSTEENLKVVIKSFLFHQTTDSTPLKEKGKPYEVKTNRLLAVLKSRVIMLRFAICALCWVANIFTYYGISQYAASFGGNRYLTYFLVSAVEIPSYVVSLWAPDWSWLGRRGSIFWSFLLGGVACLAKLFLGPEEEVLSLILYLAGKFFSTYTITVIYIFTAELFPTEVRHTLLALCSMCGRVGSILSQQTPLLALYVNPMQVFGVVSLVGAGLSLLCPETLGTKLPDTLAEAELVGKKLDLTTPHPS